VCFCAYTNRVDRVLELHKIRLASDLWELNCILIWGMSVHNGLQMSLSSHIYHIKPLSFRPSAHGATHKKLIGHANYQPISSELLPLLCNGMSHTALPVSNSLVARHKLVPSDSASQSPSYFSLLVTGRLSPP